MQHLALACRLGGGEHLFSSVARCPAGSVPTWMMSPPESPPLANRSPSTKIDGVSAVVAEDADAPLVARAQGGDRSAFDELVRRHQGMLAGLLHRFASWPADVEDLVQETFVRAYRYLPRWEPQQPFVHWLRRIAVNLGRDHCRARARRLPTEQLPDDDVLPPPSVAPAAEAALAHVREVLAELPPDDCTLLTLQYLEGLSLSEIASLLGWSALNTRVRSFRARRRLQKLLEHHGYHS